MDFSENNSSSNNDEDLVDRIRSRIDEVAKLIDVMKSKLPCENSVEDNI